MTDFFFCVGNPLQSLRSLASLLQPDRTHFRHPQLSHVRLIAFRPNGKKILGFFFFIFNHSGIFRSANFWSDSSAKLPRSKSDHFESGCVNFCFPGFFYLHVASGFGPNPVWSSRNFPNSLLGSSIALWRQFCFFLLFCTCTQSFRAKVILLHKNLHFPQFLFFSKKIEDQILKFCAAPSAKAHGAIREFFVVENWFCSI